jgi:hypothetical protein
VPKRLYGVENAGLAKGVVVDVVGDVKEAGRAGTEGGVVVVVVVVTVAEVLAGVGVDVDVDEVPAAGMGDVDAAAAAAMVPLRSQGFGGEPITQITGMNY